MTVDRKVEGVDQAREAIRKIPRRVFNETKKIFVRHVVLMRTYVRKEYLTGGTTVQRLAVRSGALRSSTRELPVKETGDSIESGLGFGMEYAKTHVGPAGQITTIKPVRGKYLAIPLDAAKTPSGVPRGGPRSSIWGETFVRKTKSGSLVIFGRKIVQRRANRGKAQGGVTWRQFTSARMGSYMSKYGGHGPAIRKIAEEWKTYRKGLTGSSEESRGGAKSGVVAGKIVPLFVLVKQVKVKTRVIPAKILSWSLKNLIADFKEIGVKLKGG